MVLVHSARSSIAPYAAMESRAGLRRTMLPRSFAIHPEICGWEAVMRSPNSVKTYTDEKAKAHADLYGMAAMAASPDGSIWVGFNHAGPGFGLERFRNGKWNSFRSMGFDSSMLELTALLLDHEGSLWVGTASQGVYRIHGDQVDSYGSADGLSSDTIQSFLEYA